MPRKKKCIASDCGCRYEVRPDHPPFRNWCSDNCAIKIARDRQDRARARAAAKAKKKAADQSKANRKAVRELNRASLSWQHKQTQAAFNKVRVLEELKWYRDRGLEPVCISCGNPNLKWTAGHFISVGAAGSLRYEPRNVWLQCWWNCNYHKSSNRGPYEEGLKARFGEICGQTIIDFCKSHTGPRKWTCEELEAMRAGFNARIRELEKALDIV